MKKVYVSELPKCDFCTKAANVDAKTVRGPWANMCYSCCELYGVMPIFGNELVLRIPAPTSSDTEVLQGIEVSNLETIVMDGDRIIKCPACDAEHSVEPDACYDYQCEGCGRRVQCAMIM